MTTALISGTDEALLTISSFGLLGIVYLAIAVSGLRERIARLEGLLSKHGEEKE